MDDNLTSASGKVDDTSYLKIWEVEQDARRLRWTIVTFFLSVSFAIFGFSFQEHLSSPTPLILRVSGVFVYWFAYLLFWYHYNWTKFLRDYLRKMEDAGSTRLTIQNAAATRFNRPSAGSFGAGKLLFGFGVLYSLGVGVLWALGF